MNELKTLKKRLIELLNSNQLSEKRRDQYSFLLKETNNLIDLELYKIGEQ